MFNLFAEDMSNALKEQTENLQSYLRSRINEPSQIRADKKLQLKINQWQNLSGYQHYRSGEGMAAIIRNEVDILYAVHQKKLDKDDEFVSTFPIQFFQSMFELVMAGQISQQFDLTDHLRIPGMPDFVFDKYFLDCTTRVTSEIDKWDKLLQNIDHFFNIIKIITKRRVYLEYWYLKSNIEQSWAGLSLDEKMNVIEDLNKISGTNYGINDNQEITKKIDELIFINQYVRFNFKDIIPDCLVRKFDALNFPQGLCQDKIDLNDKDFYFLTKVVAQYICDKLQKEYFLEDEGDHRKYGILAISLAGIRFDLLLPFCESTTKEFLAYFYQNISHVFPSVVRESKEIDSEKISKGLKNLFAILINVNTYDWSPVLQANYSGDIKNMYAVVYNTDFLEHGTYDDDLFGSFARHREVLPLSTLYMS
jgi:hypothetical protein